MKRALLFQGGWDGHEPKLTSARFSRILQEEGFQTEISDTLDCLADLDASMELALLVACWTGGEIKSEYTRNVAKAVGAGVGLAGCHGGMCDSFRQDTEWQFITGGQWVSHPGGDGVEYTVNIKSSSSPIVYGLEDLQSRVNITTCMWTQPSRYWRPPASPSSATIISPTRLWTCRSSGQSAGEMDVYFTIPWGIMTMCLKIPRRRKC